MVNDVMSALTLHTLYVTYIIIHYFLRQPQKTMHRRQQYLVEFESITVNMTTVHFSGIHTHMLFPAITFQW